MYVILFYIAVMKGSVIHKIFAFTYYQGLSGLCRFLVNSIKVSKASITYQKFILFQFR